MREALASGILFTKAELQGTKLRLTTHPDFENEANQRIINRVLASVRSSSQILKQTLHEIKNVTRKPSLIIHKNHGFTDASSILKAIIDAQLDLISTSKKNTQHNLVSVPQIEGVTPVEAVTLVKAQPVEVSFGEFPEWDFCALLDETPFEASASFPPSRSIFDELDEDPMGDSLVYNETKDLLFGFQGYNSESLHQLTVAPLNDDYPFAWEESLLDDWKVKKRH